MGSQARPTTRSADFGLTVRAAGDQLRPDAKSAYNTINEKKRLHLKLEKRPQHETKKHHDIINPVSLIGVISENELRKLLKVKSQTAWCSRVRVGGLLLLIDYLLRNIRDGAVSISADLARSYLSKLRNSCAAGEIKEPLPLLCEIGILELVRPAVHVHVCASAVYRFAEKYKNQRLQLRVPLTPKLASKLASATQRLEARLNRRHPYRQKLLRDLSEISFALEARPLIAAGMRTNRRDVLRAVVDSIDLREHFVQITTSVSNCPRELQPHLLLNEKPLAFCDICGAHWNFLPKLLADRLRHVSKEPNRQKYIADGWREHDRLTVLLSDGDFYLAWCEAGADDNEREKKKEILNILIHGKNGRAQKNPLYQRLTSEFPITLAIVEDIKRQDHRNLSIQLQRLTADAISAALLELQSKGIAAIPLVDALICKRGYHAVVSEAIGKQIFLRTAVCASVGGIRYSPLTEIEEQALAFDETAASDDTMTYDEWEALRAVKCVTALKLLRRRSPSS